MPGQIVPPPPPVEVEGEEPEYHVETVEDSWIFRKTLQYRVRWLGWPSLTWEPWYFVHTTEAVTRFHARYPEKPGPMREGSEQAELQRRGLNASGFAGAQSKGGGCCHGPDPARGHAHSPGQPTVPRLPTIEVGNRDVSLEAHSIQDLEELADVSMLWDVRDQATAAEGQQEADG